jgi:hypothetical protein
MGRGPTRHPPRAGYAAPHARAANRWRIGGPSPSGRCYTSLVAASETCAACRSPRMGRPIRRSFFVFRLIGVSAAAYYYLFDCLEKTHNIRTKKYCLIERWMPRVYLGIFSGRARKKPDSKICGLGLVRPDCRATFSSLGLVRPDCRATFSSPGPAHRGKKSSGRQAGPSVNHHFLHPRPGLSLLSVHKFLPRPGLTACFGPTGRTIFGPGRSGRATHAQL